MIAPPTGRSHFAMLEFMAFDDLDCYQGWLLLHYKRVKFETGKPCEETIRETAVACKMSAGKVSPTRKALAKKGYVTLTPIYEPGTRRVIGTRVEPIERWAENEARCSAPDQEDAQCSGGERTGREGRSLDEHTRSDQRSPHEHTGGQGRSGGERSVQEVNAHNIYKRSIDSPNGESLPEPLLGPQLPPLTKWGHWIGYLHYYCQERQYRVEVIEVEVIGETAQRVKVRKPDGATANYSPGKVKRERPALKRKTSCVQDVIAHHCFGISKNEPVGAALQTHLNTITGGVGDKMPDAMTLHRLYEAWPAHLNKPSRVGSILGMINKGATNGHTRESSTASARRTAQNGRRGVTGPTTTVGGETRRAAGKRRPPPRSLPGVDYEVEKVRLNFETMELEPLDDGS